MFYSTKNDISHYVEHKEHEIESLQDRLEVETLTAEDLELARAKLHRLQAMHKEKVSVQGHPIKGAVQMTSKALTELQNSHNLRNRELNNRNEELADMLNFKQDLLEKQRYNSRLLLELRTEVQQKRQLACQKADLIDKMLQKIAQTQSQIAEEQQNFKALESSKTQLHAKLNEARLLKSQIIDKIDQAKSEITFEEIAAKSNLLIVQKCTIRQSQIAELKRREELLKKSVEIGLEGENVQQQLRHASKVQAAKDKQVADEYALLTKEAEAEHQRLCRELDSLKKQSRSIEDSNLRQEGEGKVFDQEVSTLKEKNKQIIARISELRFRLSELAMAKQRAIQMLSNMPLQSVVSWSPQEKENESPLECRLNYQNSDSRVRVTQNSREKRTSQQSVYQKKKLDEGKSSMPLFEETVKRSNWLSSK